MFENKMCRLCLKQSPVFLSIFQDNISLMLEALTSKKIIANDEFSPVVCLKCLLQLKLVYSFQQKIKRCEEQFKDTVEIKLKPDSDENSVKLSDRCFICGIHTASSLNSHIKNHFQQKQECDFCLESFPNTQIYRKHLETHHEKPSHKCNNCGAEFLYKSLFQIHLQTICKPQATPYREKPPQITEEEAQRAHKLGLRSSTAINHLLDSEKTHVCTICHKTFSNRKTFLVHNHKTKICPICGRVVSHHNIKRHLNDHNLGPQICHICGATLQTKGSLTNHIFFRHNNLRYKCEECGKCFRKKCTKDLHTRRDHLEKPSHFCNICGKGFYTARFLRKHIDMKHEKLRPHICDFCKKGFSSRYALKTHRRQHTNETPYKCEVCGDGFRQNVSLKAHRKSKHDIVDPEVCSCKVCGRGFASDVALFAHSRVH